MPLRKLPALISPLTADGPHDGKAKSLAKAARTDANKVNAAVQGGGAHSAFSWGALDALLEDERIEIAGIGGVRGAASPRSGCAERVAFDLQLFSNEPQR